ncbi:cobalt-precorrin 5A hydrolase [Eubacterium sp. 1001713B170207_170306_E7]|uniref:cobalt-precorrin 5A hydrolase n=1 Tax=Eubacterium sp. 1001713B170207_170306_E7 TaxID=2787097 RepID=UPI00189B9F38|nr:cobalt-precorrin 5A hydrolase [Eubacterium sp. 1001713B170207_170306_E7]
MKRTERWAVVAVSRQGTQKALEVKEHISEKAPDIFTLEKYAAPGTQLIRGKIGDFFGTLMADYDTVLCMMATGIVVRSIAPHLGHKSKDPGILVMDPDGKYVISLLSGHLGYANENAIYLAKRMDAQPVITTGTDVKGSMAVDVLAEKLGCTIADFTAAKDVTALILDDEPIALINEARCDTTGLVLPPNLVFAERQEALAGDYRGCVVASAEDPLKWPAEKPVVQIVPKKIVIGIGCRRDTEAARIEDAVRQVLAALELHPLSVRAFATIGLKADEKGIHAACKTFDAELKVVPDDFVKMVQARFEGSDFVFKTTGLYAVSEPCGYVASGFGECLLEKQKCGGITLSVWQVVNKE